MAASGTAVGLSGADLDHIRDGLRAGRKPKVTFTASAGQISGQVGQVVRLDDPANSDEWVVVRFGHDELPFSPVDLALPVRGSVRRSASKPGPEAKPPEFRLGAPAPRKPARANGRVAGEAATRTVPVAAKTPPAGPKAAASDASTATAKGTTPPGRAANGEARRSPARAGRPKAPAALTVTLAYTDREWTVAATVGAKVLAKPYGIKPAEALRMVSMLDVPGVHDAVESIIAAEKTEAEDRAQRLRSELAEIEARLAELTRRP